MRGKGKMAVQVNRETRITPAYAGKSRLACRQKILHEDHPRLCGEKVATIATKKRAAGSPPPMRGKVSFEIAFGSTDRITPAYAGKSRRQGRKQLCTQDHPRLCGEKADMVRRMLKMGGSPPPMRGKAAGAVSAAGGR